MQGIIFVLKSLLQYFWTIFQWFYTTATFKCIVLYIYQLILIQLWDCGPSILHVCLITAFNTCFKISLGKMNGKTLLELVSCRKTRLNICISESSIVVYSKQTEHRRAFLFTYGNEKFTCKTKQHRSNQCQIHHNRILFTSTILVNIQPNASGSFIQIVSWLTCR